MSIRLPLRVRIVIITIIIIITTAYVHYNIIN